MKFGISACFLLSGVMILGCGPSTKPSGQTANNQVEESAGGNAHGHDDTGPHGGHLLHLEPSGGHAEWTHDDESHLITVYLNDFEADKVSNVKFVAKIGDVVEEFPLEAGEGDAWAISSEALMTHINMGEAVAVTLIVADESGEQTTKIEAHEDHHH